MKVKEKIDYLREIYHSYKVDDIVSEDHTLIFSKYIDPYINSKNKRSGKTVRIVVKESQYTQCVFYYYNKYDEYATASLPKAVRYFYGRSIFENQRRRVYNACRFDINDQIIAYKKSLHVALNGGNKCRLCKFDCEYGETQTDHYPTPFCEIFDSFMADKNMDDIEFTRASDIFWSLKDDELRSQWQQYHLNHAIYREICIECHKSHTLSQRKY